MVGTTLAKIVERTLRAQKRPAGGGECVTLLRLARLRLSAPLA